MNPESSVKIQTLEKFPVLMTKEKVAEALGVATHTIPPLVRSPPLTRTAVDGVEIPVWRSRS